MKYDKTTIIGLTACVVLFLLWPMILTRLGLVQPPRAPAAEEQEAGAPADENGRAATATEDQERNGERQRHAGSATDTRRDGTAEPEDEPDTGPRIRPPAADIEGSDPRRAPWPRPEDISIRLDAAEQVTAEVDPHGGGIVRVALHDYAQDLPRNEDDPEPVQLSRWDHPFLALNLRLSGLTFENPEERRSKPDVYEVQRRTAAGVVLSERWEIPPEDTYTIRYSARFTNEGDSPVDLHGLALEAGAAPPNVASGEAAGRGMGGGGASVAFLDRGRPQTFSSKKVARQDLDTVRMLATRPAKWIAVHSQYFVLAVIAGDMTDDAAFAGSQLDLRPPPGEHDATPDYNRGWFNARGLVRSRRLDPGENLELVFTGIAGPKKHDLLSAVGGRLDTVIGMDRFLFWHPRWMGFLTRHLLKFLVWLNDLFGVSGGYGLAIIVITVLVKVLFWPLTHHSTKSMRKMQELQPQLKEIREKYKDDPQKLYRRQSEFLKKNNVNQLGGCLPMFLQLPVFIALFITFRSAIELRHSSFLWAADLSMPDKVFGLPIRPFAILMGGTMFLQQQLTPTSADPQQKRMMSFMSVFFIFLFYSMPSGLTLYWTVNQVLTIIQTFVTRNLEHRHEKKTK